MHFSQAFQWYQEHFASYCLRKVMNILLLGLCLGLWVPVSQDWTEKSIETTSDSCFSGRKTVVYVFFGLLALTLHKRQAYIGPGLKSRDIAS